MDGLKAALVLFVASLFQLAVLTEYHPFRTSSIVLVALLSIRDARDARRHLAAPDRRRLLDRALRRDDGP